MAPTEVTAGAAATRRHALRRIPAIAAPASGTPERRRGDQTMTTNDEKDLMRVDDRTQERVIESLVLRGICRGSRRRTARGSTCRCARGSGSIPRPTLCVPCASNGKENSLPDARCDRSTRAYPPREPRDHRRPEGHRPRRDEAGLRGVPRKHPDGRMETAVATVPLVDPVNVLMKAETKSKRRATPSILGLGMLDEMGWRPSPRARAGAGRWRGPRHDGGVVRRGRGDERARDAPASRGLLRGPPAGIEPPVSPSRCG